MLKDLLYKVNIKSVTGNTSLTIKSLQTDSRKTTPGTCFIAIKGHSSDGHDFIEKAIEMGAIAIVCETMPSKITEGITYVSVLNSAVAAGIMSHHFYGEPSLKMKITGVTGTNGKTSCTQWLGQALSLQRMPTAVIGTLGAGQWRNGASGIFKMTGFTTPDAVQLHRELAEQKKQGAVALAKIGRAHV